MRLQKYLAHAGVASRRNAESLILAGRVRVNGRAVELGARVVPTDRVELDGRAIVPVAHRYLVVHKPLGVVTTMHDPQGRRTIADLVPENQPRIVPVGRLDYDSSGVVLLTNDGDLAHRLMHPRYGVEKTYRVRVKGHLAPHDVATVGAGASLGDERAAPAKLRVLARAGGYSEIDITVHEGRNREVRRIFEGLGHEVVALVRLRFGPIALGSLAPGGVREPTQRELSALLQHKGSNPASSQE